MRHSRAPKRRWYQSGLRTLLACVFVIAASHSSVPRNRRRSKTTGHSRWFARRVGKWLQRNELRL